MTLTAGTRLGVYEISGTLGAGGMGEIYRARDVRLDRAVAIKALPREFAHDPERRARFEREARLVASLSHPNIAGIYGIEDFERVPFLVLEYVPGETLAAKLSRGPLPIAETAAIASQIASAMAAAHERGIVHRDLKPGNVMLTPEGAVKVLDFGIAKADHGAASEATSDTMTREGTVLGTAAYMSPEQARGKGVDRRADVWAFGCILFECLAGRRPFHGATGTDTLVSVLEREPDWSTLPPSIPTTLREGIRRCLQKDPSQRPSELTDLRRELERMVAPQLGGASGAAASSPSLAVLYFENISSDKESEYFCAGITEDILTDLSKIKGLRVASRNAVAKFRGTVVDIPRVAADLGVTAVMEGSVRRSGDRVRITAQLINAADGFHLWAERYDRTLQDVFAVQEEIASSIAAALRGALTPSEAKELRRDRPSDARAYDLYLKGREQYAGYSRESLAAAMELFRQAIEVEPDYALAWAGVADCYGQLHQWGWDPNREGASRGLQAARRAVALNPKLAEAHKAEALVLRALGDKDGERKALLRSVDCNPRYTPALNNLAVGAFEDGNIAAAERYVREILRIDPHDPFALMWMMQLTVSTARIEETLEVGAELLRSSALNFYIVGAHIMNAAAHLMRGDDAAALSEMEGIDTADAMGVNADVVRAVVVWRRGDLAEAARLVDRAMESSQKGAFTLILAAGVQVAAGRLDRARELLSHPVVIRTMIRLSPELWPLLDDPPFAPRRCSLTLVWPKEAPPPPEGMDQLFQEIRFESAMEPPRR
ncbi:MAG TPA: protein kinase [Candidatus Eisenbacteria bacterium]|nr:protein kinase [Candidatus Eisenbacteria bacterium]